MAEFLRRARPRGLAKAASSRERSWRIGWTRMTLASLDSCTGPATMVTSRQVRPRDRPARYSGAGEGDRGHYSGCEAPVVGGFVNEGEQLSVATGHIPKPRAWILVRVRDDPGSTAKEISFPGPRPCPRLSLVRRPAQATGPPWRRWASCTVASRLGLRGPTAASWSRPSGQPQPPRHATRECPSGPIRDGHHRPVRPDPAAATLP